MNGNDVPLFDLPTVDTIEDWQEAYTEQQNMTYEKLFEARYTLQFTTTSFFSWLDTPENESEAQEAGIEALAEVLSKLQSSGLTFVQSSSMKTKSAEDSGTIDWILGGIGASADETDFVHTTTLKLVSISPNLSPEALQNQVSQAELDLALQGTINHVQISSGTQILEAGLPLWQIGMLLAAAGYLVSSIGEVWVIASPDAAAAQAAANESGSGFKFDTEDVKDAVIAASAAAVLIYGTKLFIK